jgi:hypothetical protein
MRRPFCQEELMRAGEKLRLEVRSDRITLRTGWRWRIDPYIVVLVAVASLLPARGIVAAGFDYVTTTAIGVLFFLYGARLSSRKAIDRLRLRT